jgi:hypothetical protein
VSGKIPKGFGAWGPVPLSFTMAKWPGSVRQVFEFYCAVCDKPSGIVKRSMYSTSKLLKVDYKTVYRAEMKLSDAGYLTRHPDDDARSWIQLHDPKPLTMDAVSTRKIRGEAAIGPNDPIGEPTPDTGSNGHTDTGSNGHPDKSRGQKPHQEPRTRAGEPRGVKYNGKYFPYRTSGPGMGGYCKGCRATVPTIYQTTGGPRCGPCSATNGWQPPDART